MGNSMVARNLGQCLGYSVTVPQSRVAIKEEWGKFESILPPGFHWLNPWKGQEIAGRLDLRIKHLNIRCETKTKDNVFVTIVASVQYRVVEERARDAFYKLSDPTNQIQDFVLNGIVCVCVILTFLLLAIRSCVPKMNLDSVFEQKNEVANTVEDQLEKAMEAFGYRIEQTLIVDVEPDLRVRNAMNEINAAARNRAAATEKAEAEKILQVKRAEGEAIVQVKRAEAEAEAKYLAGVGVARQRQAIVDGLRDSVLAFSSNVPATNSRDVMDMVLLTQYFDTMKDIGASSKSSTVFLPHGPGAVHDVAEQIRNGMLQAQAGTG